MTVRRRPASPERLRAWRRGRAAETLCVWHLRLRGYRILARGYRVPVGEIDIVARRGRVVAAIEVKARDSAAASRALSSNFLPRTPSMPGSPCASTSCWWPGEAGRATSATPGWPASEPAGTG